MTWQIYYSDSGDRRMTQRKPTIYSSFCFPVSIFHVPWKKSVVKMWCRLLPPGNIFSETAERAEKFLHSPLRNFPSHQLKWYERNALQCSTRFFRALRPQKVNIWTASMSYMLLLCHKQPLATDVTSIEKSNRVTPGPKKSKKRE